MLRVPGFYLSYASGLEHMTPVAATLASMVRYLFGGAIEKGVAHSGYRECQRNEGGVETKKPPFGGFFVFFADSAPITNGG